jgi:alkanesulfonate monooxygenase SsuD/methylene tetrahydromethanopterin reductase-like flavin-dependent oxidoreductase (luciferase family)
MNIGISTTATARSGDLAEVARQVEALGYDSLWIPEGCDFAVMYPQAAYWRTFFQKPSH